MNERETIICRVKPNFWWIIPLGLGEAAFFLVAPFEIAKSTPAGRFDWVVFVICWPVGALFLCVVMYCTLHLARGFVRADDAGLKWRGIGKIRSASWDEVTDFYDASSPRGARKFAVETKVGILKLDGQWTNTGALRDFIQSHATHSQSRAWTKQSKGEKWPRVFHYRGWDNRWFLPMITAVGIIFWPCFFGAILFQPQNVRAEFTDFGFLLGVLSIIGKLCLTLGKPILYALTFWPMLREVRRRQKECITATPDGLTFEDGVQRIEARWDEIANFYIAPPTRKLGNRVYVVETAHGNFDFVQELGPYQGLQTLIAERALNSSSREWKTPGAKDIETIGGEKSKWRDGQRVHSYRTRSNRAFLGGLTFFCVFMPF